MESVASQHEDFPKINTPWKNTPEESPLRQTLGIKQSSRTRNPFSSTQLTRLKREFQDNRYPNAEKVKILSQELCLKESKIMKWFSNRRQDLKRDDKAQMKSARPLQAFVGANVNDTNENDNVLLGPETHDGNHRGGDSGVKDPIKEQVPKNVDTSNRKNSDHVPSTASGQKKMANSKRGRINPEIPSECIFKCSSCTTTFRTWDAIWKHRKKFHGEKTSSG